MYHPVSLARNSRVIRSFSGGDLGRSESLPGSELELLNGSTKSSSTGKETRVFCFQPFEIKTVGLSIPGSAYNRGFVEQRAKKEKATNDAVLLSSLCKKTPLDSEFKATFLEHGLMCKVLTET